MKNRFQRLIDNKYLISATSDTWTDLIEDATIFGQGATAVTRIRLSFKYTVLEYKVIPEVVVTPPII